MSAFNAVRAGTLAIGFMLSTLGAQAHSAAYALPESPDPGGIEAPVSDEPFGFSTSPLSTGPLHAKWTAVERAIAAEAETIAACTQDPAHCSSQPALRFLEIVNTAAAREGLARLGEINRAINLAIRPVSDRAQYGVEDYWSSPLATLAAGAGDCEDYAIAKLVALRAAGVPEKDLRLVIIRETATGDDHAVVAARSGDRWRILDNRTFLMVEDSAFGKYRPLFALDAGGARRFDQPILADAAPVVQSRPAEIENRDPVVVEAGAPAIGPSATVLASDDVWMTLAM